MSTRRAGRRSGRGWRRVGLVLSLTAVIGTGICAGVSQASEPLHYASSGATNFVANVNFNSVACAPTTTTCIATGSDNNGNGKIVVIDDGIPGTAMSVPDGITDLGQVACSSASSCVIAGDAGLYGGGAGGGELLPVAVDNGAVTLGTVENVSGTTTLRGVACPSTNECVADGYEATEGAIWEPTTSVGVLVDIPEGASGTPGTAQDVSSVVGLGPISCNSAARCLANGTNPEFNGTGSDTSVLPVTLPGASAGTPEVVTGIGFLGGVSCVPGTTTCVVVGYGSGNLNGAAVAITGTTEGPAETTPDYVVKGVSCPTMTFCVGVGTTAGNPEQGYAVAFEPNSPIGSTGATDPNNAELTAVECQSAESCLEVGGDDIYGGDVDDLPLTAPTAPLSGTVTLAGTTPTGVTGAPLQACATDGSFCIDGTSGAAGAYSLSVPLGEAYVLTAFSPAGESYTEASSPATATVAASGVSGINVALEPGPALSSGVTVTSPDFGTEGSGTSLPTVNWGQPFDVHIPASEFPIGETTTVETLVITGTNTSTGLVQSDTIYAGGETTTTSGQPAANGLVVGPNGVDVPVPPLSPIHGPVSMIVNSFSVPVAPTGVAAGGPIPAIFTQGAATQQPSVVATDFGVDHTVGAPSISGPDAGTFSLNSPTACAPQSTIVQQSAANPGSDQSCGFSVTWTPPATVATPPKAYYYATLTIPVTNSSGTQAQLLVPLLGCDLRVISAGLCHGSGAGGGSSAPTVGTPIGSLYVDPSGLVETTTMGGATVPLSGATVTLLQLGSGGTYAAVPSGSDVMSPSNRLNPVVTGASGGFGWDTLAGTYEITATDSACTDSATSAPETVPPPATGIVLMLTCPGITQTPTSTNLGADPGTTAPGQAVKLTATVTGTAPTGTVTLTYGGSTLATVPVNSSTGEASYATSALPPGHDTVTATYSGDSVNAASHGQQMVTVQSATSVASATAVTATPSKSTPGASVTYSATVTPASGSSDPTGTVSFTATLGTSTTALCTATIQGRAATCSSASAPVGADTITAAYGGDTNFSASSGTTAETVSAAMTAPPATTGTTGIPTTIATSAATGTTALTGTGTTTKTVTFGNQKITLTTPSDSVCLAPSGAAAVSFITAAVKGSKATALKFRSAGIYLDRGVKHSAKVKEHGKSGSKTVISYSPNATLRRTSDEFSLSLKGLAMGAHTLRVYITYSETVTTAKAHGNERARTVTSTKTVTRSLSAAIEVC